MMIYSNFKPWQSILCSLQTRSYQAELNEEHGNSTTSDHLDPVVFEEEIPEETPVRDKEKSFKSTAHIQLKRNNQCLPSHSRGFEVERSLEKFPGSFDSQSVDAKQEVNAIK